MLDVPSYVGEIPCISSVLMSSKTPPRLQLYQQSVSELRVSDLEVREVPERDPHCTRKTASTLQARLRPWPR